MRTILLPEPSWGLDGDATAVTHGWAFICLPVGRDCEPAGSPAAGGPPRKAYAC